MPYQGFGAMDEFTQNRATLLAISDMPSEQPRVVLAGFLRIKFLFSSIPISWEDVKIFRASNIQNFDKAHLSLYGRR